MLFLRELVRSVPLSAFALKGGTNLRFFFGSIRYSEDMDIDASGIAVHVLRERVMRVLTSSGLVDSLRTFAVEELRLPDMARAKQTETVQRYKIGLLTSGGEDLATKVEFSRPGLDEGVRAAPVASEILAAYRLPPVVVPHYDARSAALQKLRALMSRAQPQARDSSISTFFTTTKPNLFVLYAVQMTISPRPVGYVKGSWPGRAALQNLLPLPNREGWGHRLRREKHLRRGP